MKRYAVCGVSNRGTKAFMRNMLTTFSEHCEVVGLLDSDPQRFVACRELIPETVDTPTYKPEEFDQMVKETKPDCILVTSRDDTHAYYIIKALEHDLDVLSEKPMATTAADCAKIMDAESRSKGKVTVTFNYRYTPYHRKVKEMILEGKVGRITSVDLNWYIDTYHGSSYFQRWNRMRKYSGGLSIHKSSHHFDLVNWWTGQKPVEAFSYGALNYYGPDSDLNPKKTDKPRFCGTCDVKWDCPYYSRWNSRSEDMKVKDDHLGGLHNAGYTNYRMDQCIFDAEIDIEDTYAAVVKYDQGALLNYTANFSTPYEGYRLAINGTKGRIELQDYSKSRLSFSVPEQTIHFFPLFGSREIIDVVKREGGHGGGDPVLMEDLFMGPDPKRTYPIQSGSRDGSYAIATGEAVWKSVKENRPIRIEDILNADTQSR